MSAACPDFSQATGGFLLLDDTKVVSVVVDVVYRDLAFFDKLQPCVS